MRYTLIQAKNEELQLKIIFLCKIYWLTQGTPKMQIMIDNLHESTITSVTNEIK